jgi:hypothetical protein
MIKHMANILDSKQPRVLGRVGTIKNGVGEALDILPTQLGKVLVLHKGLTLPVRNVEGSKDVFNTCAGLDGGVVAEETARGTVCSLRGYQGIVFQSSYRRHCRQGG